MITPMVQSWSVYYPDGFWRAGVVTGYDLNHEPPDSPSFGSEHWL